MPLLRTCSAALALALINPPPNLIKADLFEFDLPDGTKYYWTSYSSDLPFDGQVYSSQNPWLTRSKWSLTNTMEVPTLDVTLRALNSSFAGGANIKLQIHDGLFDGSSFALTRVFMPTPGDTVTLGGMGIFGGVTGPGVITGSKAVITCKGKNNLLEQYAPRLIYQVTCLHAFCDAGCTLNRASFTTNYTVGTVGVTTSFVPWSGSPPPNAALYRFGTIEFTSGAAAGSSRTIIAADSTGLTMVYPLTELPAPGDAFSAFQGCDKTVDSGTGQSCTDYLNTQNYLGFPFLPPPNSAY